MKRFHIIILAALATGATAVAMPMPQQQATEASTAATSENYVPAKAGPFTLSIPENCIITEGSELIAKNAAGTFGISAAISDARGANVTRLNKMCRELAKKMHITGTRVEKISARGLEGAVATGSLEGARVSVALLVKGKDLMKLVVMHAPGMEQTAAKVVGSVR